MTREDFVSLLHGYVPPKTVSLLADMAEDMELFDTAEDNTLNTIGREKHGHPVKYRRVRSEDFMERPAPVRTERVLRGFRGQYLEDVSPAVIAYALGMKYHGKLKDLRGSRKIERGVVKMKVKAVKKKPAPIEAEQVYNRLLDEHRRRWRKASAEADKHLAEAMRRKNEEIARFRQPESLKVCREDAIDAMEAVCKNLKMMMHGPSIKDLRISDMIALHKVENPDPFLTHSLNGRRN